MTVIEGRFAEARLYLHYAVAVLRPGVRMPTFAAPVDVSVRLGSLKDDDLRLLVEEARRSIDRQQMSLEQIRARSGTLLTIGLAEIALLSALAAGAFKRGALVYSPWLLAAVAVVLAIGGAASVLTSQARMGWVDVGDVVSWHSPLINAIALDYLHSMAEGAETVRTRLTVLRDVVMLETLAALFLAGVWPFTL